MSWPLIALKDLVDINIGRTPSRDNSDYWGSGTPWLSIRDMSQGKILLKTAEQITPQALEDTKIGIAKKGTVLFSFKLSIGKVGIAGLDMCHNEAIASMPIKQGVEMCEEYLYFALKQLDSSKDTDRAVMGATLNKKKMAELKIPLPPLETQKQIAAVLEQADQLRKDCQQMEQELNSLAQSVFIEMFGDPVTNPKGWDKRPLLELVADKDDIKCGPFGTQLGKSEFTTEGVPLWGIKHVNSGFKKPTVEFVSHEKALALKAYSIVGGDIVMTRKGNVGNCYIYPDNLQSGIMHSDLLRIRPCSSTVSAPFLQKQFMYSKDVEGQLKLISQGAIMAGINVTKLKSLMLLSPPLEEQKKFETFLSEVEANKITLAHKLRESNNIFNSLLQKAFKGELNL